MSVTADLPEGEALESYRPAFAAALIVIACLIGATLGWGMYARLDAAVVTQGVLLAESKRKTVEHLEGGILERLMVKAGDRVEEGQIVATLDTTQTREALAQFEADRLTLSFDIWRLEAERDGAAQLDPATAPDAPEAGRAQHVTAATQLFDARLRAHVGQVSALRRQIDQIGEQIAASAAQALAAERQLDLWEQERALNSQLVATGATPKQKLLEFDRTIAALEGKRDEHRSLKAAAEQEIARARLEIETLEQQRLAEVGTKLGEARRLVAGLASRIRAARDVLERQNLRAPQSGRVVDIYTVTPGAVIGSGAPLMEIVPDGDRLVVSARLQPDAIDTVHVGRQAKVKLTAYKRAQQPILDGEVTYVSADLIKDERDGTTYFDARITLAPEDIAAHPDALLTAGMPVEVSITIGERRAGDYMLEPLLRHLRGAFREE